MAAWARVSRRCLVGSRQPASVHILVISHTAYHTLHITHFISHNTSYHTLHITHVITARCHGLCVQQAPGGGARCEEEGAPGPALTVHQQQPTWPEAEAGVEVGGEEAVGRGDGDGDSVP